MTFQQLPTLKSAMRGSYIALLYAPVSPDDDYTPIVDADGKALTGPSGINGWYAMPAVVVASRHYSVKTVESKQGELYDITIQGSLYNVSPQALKEFKRLKKSEFAIRMNTLDGTTWLMADLQYPATFDFSVDGGTVGNDRSRITFTFKGKMPYPPYKTV